MPAIVEADDDGLYVLKFRGAAQGPRALIAELVAGELGRILGLPIPEIVFADLDPVLGKTEPDYEIRQLVMRSGGLNLALDFLPGSFAYHAKLSPPPPPDFASAVVWFDAYVTNVDRTPRNPNILLWHKRPWLIDHGACLYFHHAWADYLAKSRAPFPQVREHVLLPHASELREADARLSALLTPDAIREIVGLIPAAWLGDVPAFASVEEHREAYVAYLASRLQESRAFVEVAEDARAGRV